MADAKNNAVVRSDAASDTVINSGGSLRPEAERDVISIAFYDAATDGNLLGGGTVGNDPNPLVLGERYEHAIGSIILRQPVVVGSTVTNVNGQVLASANTADVVVDDATGLSANDYIAIAGKVYEIDSIASNTLTLTANVAIDIADDAIVAYPLETEESAKRKLEG